MGKYYERFARPVLFRQDSERAHELGVDAMAWLAKLTPLRGVLEWWTGREFSRVKPIEAFGLRFPTAVGLAAGFDKNARAWPAAAALGFGHVEIGTVTAHAAHATTNAEAVPRWIFMLVSWEGGRNGSGTLQVAEPPAPSRRIRAGRACRE